MWTQLETLHKQLETLTPHVTKDVSRIQQGLDKKKEELQGLEQEIDTLDTHSRDLLKLLTDGLRNQYLLMLESIPNPAVVIEGKSCSGCYSRIPQADLGKAEKGEIITCKDCSRFLYYLNGQHE